MIVALIYIVVALVLGIPIGVAAARYPDAMWLIVPPYLGLALAGVIALQYVGQKSGIPELQRFHVPENVRQVVYPWVFAAIVGAAVSLVGIPVLAVGLVALMVFTLSYAVFQVVNQNRSGK